MAVVVLSHESPALRGNPLGDPHVRKLHLVVPDDLSADEPVPCLWYLAGYAGLGRGNLSDDPWQEGIEERCLRLRREGRIGKLIVALPDAFTRFGGCQYLGSPAVGDYERYLVEELPRAVEARFPIAAHGLFGKSSGGFGALVHAMRHPERFRAVACHSGDMGFEHSVFPDLRLLVAALSEHGSIERFLAEFEASPQKKDWRWLGPMMSIALASVFSPDPGAPMGIGLPFDPETSRLRPEILERWLAWDPLRMIEEPGAQAALRQQKLVFVDCGSKDEHFLYLGARSLHRRLDELRIAHVYEEFRDGHRNTGYRLDRSIPALFEALSPGKCL